MAEKPEQADRATELKILEYESLLAGYHSRDESIILQLQHNGYLFYGLY